MRRAVWIALFVAYLQSASIYAVESTLAHLGPDGHLIYGTYANQNETNADNRLPNFSFCGYMGGGVPIPDVPTVLTVWPQEGDDTQSVQNAINAASALTEAANGFRGAVLLKAGRYQISATLRIQASGVVLRGEGQDVLGTILEAVTPLDYDVFSLGSGSGSYGAQSGTTRAITSAYVPSGAVSFDVAGTSGYAVGDWISVQRTPNQFWIDDLAMGQWGWTPGGYTTDHERYVTAVSGNTITVDVPLVDVYQEKYGGGQVFKLNPITRIHKSGIENLRLESCYAGDTDEAHPWDAIRVQYAENCWVRGVTARYFAYSCVNLGSYARYITTEDCAFIDPKSVITGGRRYSFNIESTATRNLFQRCYSHESRHDFVLGSKTRGPNAFVDCYADRSHADAGPHHRWSTGTLFDNVYSSNSLGVENRESSGSGHGWSGAQMVFWNCKASNQKCDAPKGGMSFAIGSKANKQEGSWAPEEPFGWWEHQNSDVTPRSLYFQQLYDRLGPAAVNNVTTASQRAGNIWSEILAWAGAMRFQPNPLSDNTPKDRPLEVGGSVIFEAIARADADIAGFQWYEILGSNYNPIGENSPLLVISNAQADDLGRKFFCRVMTNLGPYWSRTVTIADVLAGANVALAKMTAASSVYSASYTADKAVDGNPGTFWNSAGGDDFPWWRVDLADNYSITQVNFINRATSTASLLARLSDLQIQVLDAAQAVLLTSPLINPQNQTPVGSNGMLSFVLPVPTAGRFVKVAKMTGTGQSYSDTQANIAEIQVLAAVNLPEAPVNVRVSAGEGTILLDWDDNLQPDFSQYVIYRSIAQGTGYSRVAEGLVESSYTDADALDLQTRYYYVIRCENTGGQMSGFSSEVSCIPRLSPAVPTGLYASGGNGVVQLNWDAATQPGFAGFTLYRSRRIDTGYIAIASGLTVREYLDDTVENNKAYYYVLTASNQEGTESAFSTAMEAVPHSEINLAPSRPVTASSYYSTAVPEYAVDGLVLNYPEIWYSAQDGSDLQPWIRVDLQGTYLVDKIKIHHWPNPGTYSRNRDFDLDVLDEAGTLIWSNYDETTGLGQRINEGNWMNSPAMIEYLLPVTITGRYIVLTKRSGLVGASATANISELEIYRKYLAPRPITNLTAASASGRVVLNWNDSTPPAVRYCVYRRSADSEYVQIAADEAAGQYEDLTADSGTTYFYIVTGVDAEGIESGFSTEVSVLLSLSADLDLSGRVDLADFALMARQWLSAGTDVPTADIAPGGGDQSVDYSDLMVLAQEWLMAQ